MKSRLFAQLERERASGRTTTLKDWLARNPPPASSFTQTVAHVADRVRAGEPFLPAVREFLDEFKFRPEELRDKAIADEPAPTGDERYDAYLAALAEHIAGVEGLKLPQWTRDDNRFLDRFWFVSEVTGFRAIAIAQSPAAFRRRGIFISSGSLERV
jgi:hypothetical protein